MMRTFELRSDYHDGVVLWALPEKGDGAVSYDRGETWHASTVTLQAILGFKPEDGERIVETTKEG